MNIKDVAVLRDHKQKKLTFRTLGKKYGISATTAYRIVMKEKKRTEQEAAERSAEEEVKFLREELRKANLKNELLDTLIDIASKELKVDIRKKAGTRRS
jgi:ribosomal protein S13